MCRLIAHSVKYGVDSVGFDINTIQALLTCAETDDGRFEIFCDEYSWPANFCPYCGAKAAAQVDSQLVYTDRQRVAEGSK
jgi:hypothetical protein